MARDGSGVYGLPPGSTFSPNTTILSSKMNQILADLAADQNTPRPLVAGGTGATTAGGARAALGVEAETTLFSLSSNTTLTATHSNGIIRCTAAITLAMDPAATLGSGWHAIIIADGADVILDPNTTEQIDGATTVTIPNGYSAVVFCDGSAFRTDREWATVSAAITALNASAGNSLILLSTAVSMSSTAVNFTGIPSTAKRVTIHLNGMSTNGTSNIALRLGPSAGVETTGYAGNVSGLGTDSAGTQSAGTSALNILYSIAASEAYSGKIVLEKVSGNLWSVVSHLRSTITTQYLMNGSKTLAGALERVQVFTSNGTDTFDAGTANISWEL